MVSAPQSAVLVVPHLLIGRFNGQRMTLHMEKTTKMSGLISRGDRIEAKVGEVDYQTHVLSLRQLKE
jgi:hypothetical protein